MLRDGVGSFLGRDGGEIGEDVLWMVERSGAGMGEGGEENVDDGVG